MRKWQIKKKSPIGQQLIHAYDSATQKWIQETAYGEPCFYATVEEARQKLANFKANSRNLKWMRLYEISG